MRSDNGIGHRGVVRSVAGGQAVVALDAGGCSGCGHRGGCGIGRLAAGRGERLVTVAARPGLVPGAEVTFELEGGPLLRAAALGYLVPAVLMIGGAAAGHLLGGDPLAVAGALAGLAFGVAATRFVAAPAPGSVGRCSSARA